MNGRSCYLAGAMRGIPDFNFPAFDEARDELERQGWRVTSPADLDREHGFTGHPPQDHEFSAGDLRKLVRRDADAILSLRRESGDAIVLLPPRDGHRGWADSVGARAEVALALWLKLNIYVYQWETRRLMPVDVYLKAASVEIK